jgi:lysophospholipase L1-like esterase
MQRGNLLLTPRSPTRAGELISGPGPAWLSGRFDLEDPAGPRFAWPGSAIELRFQGRAIALWLRGSSDHFAIELDGRALPPIAADPSRERYSIAEGLEEGPHELRITKRTEPLVSEAQLLGLELEAGGELLPPPPAPERRIELVGDSITAGFGVLGRDQSPFSPATEDFTRSYGALTARALGAEPIAVAWSGRGVVRNYADEPGDPMPVLYERTLPARATSRWDFRCWVPDLVVVNLGQNDFSPGRPPTEARFVEGYAALLRRIHAVYPRAFLIGALGPMLSGPELEKVRGYLERIVALLHGEGLTALASIEHPPQSPAEGYGCDWHPSARTHARMAEQLTATIRALLGWS